MSHGSKLRTLGYRRMGALLALLVGVWFALSLAPAEAGKYTDRYARISAALVEKGKAALAKQDYQAASQAFEQAVVANPHNALGFSYLGLVKLRMGDKPVSKKYFDIALEIDPNQIQALSWAGQADLAGANLESAEAKLQRLSRLCGPNCTEYKQLSEAVSSYKTTNPAN
jgi:tetratricopeptide (TPR) repeat protein